MALPRFTKPIPVRFLTDFVKALQNSAIDGPLKGGDANDLVTNVMAREHVDQSVAIALDQQNRYEHGEREFTDEDEDPLLMTLDKVVEGILTGQSLEDQKGKIKQYIFNQQERAELISNLLLTKDYQRLIQFTKVRDELEKKLLSAALRGDLNVPELMAMMQMVGDQTSKLENRVQAGASNVSDVLALLNKADYHLHLHEDTIKEKFKHTTSTGREIVRRMIHKLQKVDKAGTEEKR